MDHSRLIHDFVTDIDDKMVALEKDAGHRKNTIQRKLRTVLSGCGWAARGPQNVAMITQALAERGLYTVQDLGDPKLDLDNMVTFTRYPPQGPPPSRLFPYERDLARYVANHHDVLFASLPGLQDLVLLDAEFESTYAERPAYIDLLFREPGGRKVIVELKVGDAGLEPIGQLQRYIDALRDDGEAPRGVLITARPRSEAVEREAIADLERLRPDYEIDWYWYELDVTLQPAVSGAE